MLDAILRDLRTALRGFRRTPRFTLLATAAFAVGVGANTAIFTVVDDVLLDPLPFPAADEVVAISEVHLERGIPDVPAAPAKIDAWAARTDLFGGVAAWRLEEMDLATGPSVWPRPRSSRARSGGMLYGVAPLDPVSYLGVGAGLVGLAVAGAWFPARRAVAVEPSEALREG